MKTIWCEKDFSDLVQLVKLALDPQCNTNKVRVWGPQFEHFINENMSRIFKIGILRLYLFMPENNKIKDAFHTQCGWDSVALITNTGQTLFFDKLYF